MRPSRFESVLSGYVPGTDLRLGRMREGEHVHRPGWDITLSAPKSVSLEALVMGDRRVIRAHDEVVRATLDFVEAELLQTRGWDPATRRRPRVSASVIASPARAAGCVTAAPHVRPRYSPCRATMGSRREA